MPVSADAESRVVVAMCTAAAGSPAAVYRTFCLFHRMSCVAGLATSQWRRIKLRRTLAKLRGLRVRTRDCQLSLWSGPFRTAGLSLWQFLQILGRSSRLTRASNVRHDPPIRGAPTRSRIRISSFAGPQATQLVAQATADCPPLRSADCAPLYQASSPSRSQVTQASAQQPCVRAPPTALHSSRLVDHISL